MHNEYLRSSLFNRKWYYASRHPRLHGKLILWGDPLKNYEKVYRLKKFTEAYQLNSTYFPFNDVEVNDSFLQTDLLAIMGYILKNQHSVKKLTLKVAQNTDNFSEHVTADKLYSIVVQFINLEHLVIELKCNNTANDDDCITLHTQQATLFQNNSVVSLEISGCLFGIRVHLPLLQQSFINLKLLKLSINCAKLEEDEDLIGLLNAIRIIVGLMPEIKVELIFVHSNHSVDQFPILLILVNTDIFPNERVTITSFDLHLNDIPRDVLQEFGTMHTDIKSLSLNIEYEEVDIPSKYLILANKYEHLESLVLICPNVPNYLQHFSHCTNLQVNKYT